MMGATPRRLAKAPIAEALIDMRVPVLELPQHLEETLRQRLGDQFPIVNELGEVRIGVAAPERTVETTARRRGFSLKSRDGVEIGQFRFDGFTFNRLKPYTSWEDILPKALRLWGVYREVVSPPVVTRIAVRYINRLTLPDPVDLGLFLTAPPVVPDGVPRKVTGFLQRVILVDDSSGIAANVTQASEAGIELGQATVILDVDVYRPGEFESGDATLGSILEELRAMKNRIFFASITEATARLYE